jgi:tripartite-type tricarboxylate transporter receptor subunit TctC
MLGMALVTPPQDANAADAVASFPSKPIRLIVTAAAGAATDVLSRKIAQIVHEQSGANLVVENIAGASGSIGLQMVQRAAPDGYTLAVALPDSVTTYPMSRNPPPYDVEKDLTPIAQIGETNYAIIVNGKDKASTLKEFIAESKNAKMPLNFASSGNATTGRIAFEVFRQQAGLDMTHIPYRSATPALLSVAQGDTVAMATSPATAKPLIANGQVKALAIMRADRSPLAPDIPSAKEAGLPNMIVPAWWGVFAPPKMPQALAEKLGRMFSDAVASKEFAAQAAAMGAEPKVRYGKEFASFIAQDARMWRGIVDAGHLQLAD